MTRTLKREIIDVLSGSIHMGRIVPIPTSLPYTLSSHVCTPASGLEAIDSFRYAASQAGDRCTEKVRGGANEVSGSVSGLGSWG